MPDEKKPWKEVLEKESKMIEKRFTDSPEKKEFRKKIIEGYINDSIDCLKKLLEENQKKIERIAFEMVRAYHSGKQIITMGNGGSAAVASHMASDFSKAWLGDGLMRMRSFSLVDNVSLLTAWMNDAGYEQMFVGPLKNILNKGDVVIGISASGNSKNVLRAVEYASKKDAVTIGFTGFDGGKLKHISKISVVVPSDKFKRIEDMHSILGHLIKAVMVNEIKSGI
jgi:D-sedoheptulose 7-phosphate isomerase